MVIGENYSNTIQITMDLFINNPGLQHISQNIFLHLDHQSLLSCRYVSQSWRHFLDNPRFWLNKIQKDLTQEHFTAWNTLLKKLDHDSKLRETVTLCLFQMHEKSSKLFPTWLCKKSCCWFDSPCINALPLAQMYMMKLDPIENSNDIEDLDEELNQDLIVDQELELNQKEDNDLEQEEYDTEEDDDEDEVFDFNAATKCKESTNLDDECKRFHFSQSPLQVASAVGALDLVYFIIEHEISSISKDNHGYTPIHRAALYGHSKVVRALALHTENPNECNNDGITPIHMAAMNGHTDVVKILLTYSDNPNTPDNNGVTPFLLAVWNRQSGIDTRGVYDSLNIDQGALKILGID